MGAMMNDRSPPSIIADGVRGCSARASSIASARPVRATQLTVAVAIWSIARSSRRDFDSDGQRLAHHRKVSAGIDPHRHPVGRQPEAHPIGRPPVQPGIPQSHDCSPTITGTTRTRGEPDGSARTTP